MFNVVFEKKRMSYSKRFDIIGEYNSSCDGPKTNPSVEEVRRLIGESDSISVDIKAFSHSYEMDHHIILGGQWISNGTGVFSLTKDQMLRCCRYEHGEDDNVFPLAYISYDTVSVAQKRIKREVSEFMEWAKLTGMPALVNRS